MLRLLRRVSAGQLRASRGRTSLVVGGIALGVALIVAIDVINISVLDNFRRTIEAVAGPAQLQVALGVGEVGFAESAVDVVRADPDVKAAVPLVRGTISLAENPTATLQLFGADLVAEEELRYYPIATSNRKEISVWLQDPRSILITSELATRLGRAVGGTIALSTPAGVATLTVRGLLEAQGLAAALGGRLAIMDLPAAQILLAKLRKIDQIDVVLRDGADVDTVRQRLERALPTSLSVTRPEQRGEQYERILASFQTLLTGFSLLCIVAGIYIVYNTTSTGAAHRVRSMAALLMIGAESKHLFRLLMLEALALGITGAIIGVPLGILLAQLLTGMVSDSMGEVFQLRLPVEHLAILPAQLVIAALLGVGAALFASFFVARRFAALEPLDVMRADAAQVEQRGAPARRLVLWWLALVAVSVAALVLEVRLQSTAWGNFGSTLWFASSIVIAVPLVTAVAAFLSRILVRISPGPGRVAAESLFRSPTRTGVTVAAVALVLTVALTFASLVESLRRSASKYYEKGGFLSGDLVVSAVSTEGGWLETPLPESVAHEIENLPGVRSVDIARALPGQIYRDDRVTVLGLTDGLLASSHYGPQWYRYGDPFTAAEALTTGTGANVSLALAQRHGLKVGDTITLETPTEPIRLPIAGVVYDYMADRGTVTINRRLLVDYWKEKTIHRLSVFVEPGTPIEGVRLAIDRQLGDRYRLKILLPGEMVDYHVGHINRAFAFTDAIQLLIIIVTVAGIFDLLVAAIWERRRELALWRVIGADQRTVRHSVVIESATIGCLGALLGTAVGLVTAWIWIGVNFPYLLGFHLDYHLAVGPTIQYVLLVLAMTIIAGYSAARYATTLSVLEGIQTD
jgi:putative ABC transport system permease protein